MRRVKLLLYNIRSVWNVGAIMRTAEGLGVEEILLGGWTPMASAELPHVREKLLKEIHKTALGAEKMVDWRGVSREFELVETEIKTLKASGWTVVALENNLVRKTVNLAKLNKVIKEKPILLVVGEEVGGICAEILRLAEVCTEIEMRGRKESFNVAVATGMALYELLGREQVLK